MFVTTLTDDDFGSIDRLLGPALAAFDSSHPGDTTLRHPVHVVYGGAQLFTKETAAALGSRALETLERYAPDATALVDALAWRDTVDPALANRIHDRVIEKLQREPVEDFRIDFEDGFGVRPDDEEDRHAVRVAEELVSGMTAGSLPTQTGLRIKTLTRDLTKRSLRTLDLVLSGVTQRTGGELPPSFVVTLPKVTAVEQVTALARALDMLEERLGIDEPIPIELMIETPQSILDDAGRVVLPALVNAAQGRCRGAHFGTYDYTALRGITAAHQSMAHEACSFALELMQVSLAQRGVQLSDGATNVMPVGPHRATEGASLTMAQVAENRHVVHSAWRLMDRHVRSSLVRGFYQGWDLHPAQLPVRYATTYRFFLEGLGPATDRLRTFVERSAQATLLGDVFDDAATGQGLLNYFLRGRACGAISDDETRETGLSTEELELRSFQAILDAR
jgi:citrate lyase beta subunit